LSIDGDTLTVAMGSLESLQRSTIGGSASAPVYPVLADPKSDREKIEEFFIERMLAGVAGDVPRPTSRKSPTFRT